MVYPTKKMNAIKAYKSYHQVHLHHLFQHTFSQIAQRLPGEICLAASRQSRKCFTSSTSWWQNFGHSNGNEKASTRCRCAKPLEDEGRRRGQCHEKSESPKVHRWFRWHAQFGETLERLSLGPEESRTKFAALMKCFSWIIPRLVGLVGSHWGTPLPLSSIHRNIFASV